MTKMDELYTELAQTKEEKEPAWRTGSVVAGLTAILSTVTYFVPIEPRTQTLILSVGIVLIPWILTYFIRKKVWSPATVNEILEDLIQGRNQLEDIKDRNTRSMPKDFFGEPVKRRPEHLGDDGKPMPDIQHDPEEL